VRHDKIQEESCDLAATTTSVVRDKAKSTPVVLKEQ